MNNRALVYEAVKLIDDHLRSNLSVTEVAERIGFSHYYFSRLFKGIIGMSPSTYMSYRKISDSVELLMTTEMKIIDIAILLGYGSSEAYSRAFTKYFSQTPTDVRHNGLINGHLMMQQMDREQVMCDATKLYRQPELIRLNEVALAGIAFYQDVANGKNDLSTQWSTFMNHITMLPDRMDPPAFYQMQMWFDDTPADSIYFFIATAVHKSCAIPIQMTYKTIPSGEYLRFQHQGIANQVGQTYRYIYEDWLPNSDYRLAHPFNFEYYGDKHLGPYNPNSITEIYIPVIL